MSSTYTRLLMTVQFVLFTTTLLVITSAVTVPAGSATAGTQPGASSELRPVACNSSYFTANGASGVEKQSFTIQRPNNDLSLYTDQTRRIEPVAAPRGWRCRVAVYGDGSTLLVVSPHPIESNLSLGTLYKIHTPVIAFYNASACGSCTFEIACGAIRSVGQLTGYGLCPQLASDRQRTWTIKAKPSDRAVGFSDPPTTKGIGWPSGGKEPVSGVVVYRSSGLPEASIETCEAPEKLSSMCSSVTDYFVTMSWQLGSTG
jgi:hypothetical protein